jgi:hypothetical protein
MVAEFWSGWVNLLKLQIRKVKLPFFFFW